MKNFRPKDVDDDGDDDEEGGEGGVEADHDGLAAYLLVAHPGLPHLPPGLPSQFLNRHWLLEQSQYDLPLASLPDHPPGCRVAWWNLTSG